MMRIIRKNSFVLALALLVPGSAFCQYGQRVSLYGPGTQTATGVAASPLRIDPVGTTQQPVSQGTPGATTAPWPVRVCDASGTCLSLTAGIPVNESLSTMSYCRVIVGTTATALRCAASNLTNRRKIYIFNAGTTAIFIGSDASVATTSGYPIPGLSSGLLSSSSYSPLVLDAGSAVTVYAISSALGQDIRVMEGS